MTTIQLVRLEQKLETEAKLEKLVTEYTELAQLAYALAQNTLDYFEDGDADDERNVQWATEIKRRIELVQVQGIHERLSDLNLTKAVLPG